MRTRLRPILIVALLFPVVLSGCFHLPKETNQNVNQVIPLNQNSSSVPLENEPELPTPLTFPFGAPQVADYFRDSVPQSQDILPQAPIQITIDSTLPLNEQSVISITNQQGVEYGFGPVSLNENKTNIRRQITQSAPNGLYTVTYSLCDEAFVCSSGQFQFAIDSFWLSQYQNWTDLAQVNVSLSGNSFLPRYLRVTAGTTVTWINDDEVSHTVDSDPLLTHSYNPSLSSFELQPGDMYSFTFGRPGLYPYRCSVHPQTMTGVVVVE